MTRSCRGRRHVCPAGGGWQHVGATPLRHCRPDRQSLKPDKFSNFRRNTRKYTKRSAKITFSQTAPATYDHGKRKKTRQIISHWSVRVISRNNSLGKIHRILGADSPIRKKRGFADRAHQNASRTREKGRFAEGMASYERLVEILEFMYSTYVRINFGVLV